MSWIERYFKKKILLKYDNSSIEELFMSSFVEQINDFQVYFSSLTLFLYSLLTLIVNILDEQIEYRTMKIILFSVELGISILVFLVGRSFMCSRFIILYTQQIFFIAIHTLLIVKADNNTDKLYLILVTFCIHIIVMPQSQHVYILISNMIYFSLLMYSNTQFDWKEMWQVWVLFGIAGLEIRFYVDEKQKRILFHDESFQGIHELIDQDVQPPKEDQATRKQSANNSNFNQNDNNMTQEQQYRQLQTQSPRLFSQQGQDVNGNNILLNNGLNNQEMIEINKLNPSINLNNLLSNQQISEQYNKGEAIFSSQNILNNQYTQRKQPSLLDDNPKIQNSPQTSQNQKLQNDTIVQSQDKDRSNTVSNLKRKMTVFQMRKGMEDLRKLIYQTTNIQGDSGQVNSNGGNAEANNGFNLSMKDIPFSIQLSPLLPNIHDSPHLRRQRQNNLFNLVSFSVMHGRLDQQNINLIFANNKAKSQYQILDTNKFDEFLQKCKISSCAQRIPLEPQNNTLKKMIFMKLQDCIEERKNTKYFAGNTISNTQQQNAKRIGNPQLTVNEKQQRNQIQGKLKSLTQIQQQNYGEKTLINQNIGLKDNSNEVESIELLIDINGQKWITKLSLLQNNEFFIVINDDSFEKFILDQKKKTVFKQLLSLIDMMKLRFQSISNMLLENTTKKEVLYETYLASNYIINMRNSFKDILQGKPDIQQKKFKLNEMLQKVKDMVERESKKNVQIIIDEDIPNNCKRIYNDYYLLYSTITNIIENAYNNTENGFVKVLVHQSRIFQDNLRFDIIDSGKGIDPYIVKLINEDNFFSDNEEEDAINKFFMLFTSLQNKNTSTGDKTFQSNDNEDEKNQIIEDTVIKGLGLKFSHNMIKVLGPYNRIYVESIPEVGSRISFIVYKEGLPSQEGYFKPYQFKNDNFEQEIAYFNPLNTNPHNNQNCSLKEYIQNVISKLEPNPFISNSLLNINKPPQTKKFMSPFSKPAKPCENNNNIQISTSIKQHQQKKNKVSFSKIFSSKNIIDQQKNQFANTNQLSPQIQAISPNNQKHLNQNSISLSPPTQTQKSYYQEGVFDNISNYFRNFQPAQSQMYSEVEKANIQNGININQITSRNHVEIFNSPKNNQQNSQYFPNIVLNFPSALKNYPTQNQNNFIVVQDTNQNSNPNLNGNPIGNNLPPISLQNINTSHLNQNSNSKQPVSSNKYHSSGNSYSVIHTLNSKGNNKNIKQLNTQNYQDKLVFDFPPDSYSHKQIPGIDQNNGQQDQTGIILKNLQKTN